MSKLIHCDGPDCTKTKDPGLPDMRRLGERGWIHVDQDDGEALDFHDVSCMGMWADDNGGLRRPDGRPCTCNGAHANPHTKAEHQAYPQATTVVDGR